LIIVTTKIVLSNTLKYNSALQLCPGEVIFDHFNNIEDIKGSKGDSGVLSITNLRIIWFSEKNIKRNISNYNYYFIIFIFSYYFLLFFIIFY